MSKKHSRRSEINRRQVRRQKLDELRKRLKAAGGAEEKAKLVEKLRKVAPWLNTEKLAQ
jgi:hypothetical protein